MISGFSIQPELTWTGDRFEPGLQIVIEADGMIGSVGPATGAGTAWPGRAVLPGMINAHSHAFQRGLRGRGETFPEGGGSFWTWRETMYDLVETMDEATMHELSCRAFREMLTAGITTVGEFHYLHHDPSGRGFALDEVVLAAAAETGIRIVLLNVFYRTGGIDRPLEADQLRFATDSPDEFWAQLDRLRPALDPVRQGLGVAAHSIRAVPLDDLVALHEESRRRGLVFHMHVEEQPAEIKACEAALGGRPMALLNERLAIDQRFCAVHCTHTDPGDMAAFLAAGGTVCICPMTEANLGDGIPDVPEILGAGGRICLGTDSNARIAFTDEMRLLEYAQRLTRQTRGVAVNGHGRCATRLWQAATSAGAHALGVNAGAIKAGCLADLVALDLTAPTLAGWTPDTLLESFIFGAGREAIAEVMVGGKEVTE